MWGASQIFHRIVLNDICLWCVGGFLRCAFCVGILYIKNLILSNICSLVFCVKSFEQFVCGISRAALRQSVVLLPTRRLAACVLRHALCAIRRIRRPAGALRQAAMGIYATINLIIAGSGCSRAVSFRGVQGTPWTL